MKAAEIKIEKTADRDSDTLKIETEQVIDDGMNYEKLLTFDTQIPCISIPSDDEDENNGDTDNAIQTPRKNLTDKDSKIISGQKMLTDNIIDVVQKMIKYTAYIQHTCSV